MMNSFFLSDNQLMELQLCTSNNSVIDIKATFIVLPLGRTFQMTLVQDCIILI